MCVTTLLSERLSAHHPPTSTFPPSSFQQTLWLELCAMETSLSLSLRIMAFLHYDECPECGEEGRHTHDGDCTRDGWDPGRGIFGDAPAFFGTEFAGFAQVMQVWLGLDVQVLSLVCSDIWPRRGIQPIQ